jgi:hypothetical protein
VNDSRAPVSVVIPVLNGAHLIEPALESIACQSVRPRQVTVVESTVSHVSSRSTCERHEFVDFVQCDARPAGTLRNMGASLSTQPFLAFLDCDDIWPVRRTEVLLEAFSVNPDVEYVGGLTVQVELDVEGDPVVRSGARPSMLPTCALMRRELFERVGGFRDKWQVGETIEWWSRASDAGVVAGNVDEVTLMRRLHDSNTGRTTQDVGSQYLRMLHDVITRRRVGEQTRSRDHRS